MKNTISVLMVALILVLIACERTNPFATSPQIAQDSQIVYSLSEASTSMSIFGPETFIRSKGEPVTEVREFSVQGDFADTELILINGNSDKKTKVTSCYVILNSDTIISPKDINKKVDSIQVAVNLEQTNLLQVKLAGKPGTYITIKITGYPSIPTNGLIAYYPFNGNANDESGNEYNGVVNGATLTADRFDNDSSAYSFDGSTSWIDIGTEFSSPDTAIAISAWIYLDSYPNDPDFFQNCFSVVNKRHSFILQIFGVTGVALVLHNGYAFTGFWQNEPITSIFSLYTWYHIVVSYSVLTTQKRIYIDGQSVYLEDRPDGSPSIITPTNEALKIGTQNDGSSQWFNGKIDNVRIYNRTLSEVEIQALYNE